MLFVWDLIFPRMCYSCGEKTEKDFICKKCSEELQYFFDDNICDICGSKLINGKCIVCSTVTFHFDYARSVFAMNKIIRNLIHNFKYKDLPIIGNILADYAINYMKKNRIFLDTDYIVAVPLHRVKKRMRGFNQSEVMAKEIAKNLNFSYIKDLIIRKKFTETQTKLSKKEREKNVGNAFVINKRYDISLKNILIIDDVFTTGSTVNSIAKVLKSYNVKKVYVLTMARAV